MTRRLATLLERTYPALAARRGVVALFAYISLAGVSFAIATFARLGPTPPEGATRTLLVGLAILLPVRAICFIGFKVQRSRWRFVGLNALASLAAATTTGSVVFYLLGASFGVRLPATIMLVEWLLTTNGIACVWITYRLAIEWTNAQTAQGSSASRRVLIVGAGEAGSRLARELRRPGPIAFRAVGFVDDDPLKWGSLVDGVEVLGSVEDLPRFVDRHRPDEILVATPSAGPEAMRRIVTKCEAAELHFRVLPGIEAVLKGSVSLDQLRDVRIEDLLGRDPIKLELPELAEDLAGQVVVVTGAAGSIGSEICRQVALHKPSLLILVDQAESPLFFIERELVEHHRDLGIRAVVGDIRDTQTLAQVFGEYEPTRVFHAAAYKHVPLMEGNVRQAVCNNVVGTWRVAEAAARYGAEKFVLISTDKAVRPSSVMGATKRAAELVVLGFSQRYPSTRWTAVRFGNVLGSAGSVIPIFREQLARGRPLTVTHEEVTRFFMTIPEAVQLVLQASLLPEAHGHIAMLDMGEPVRIMDLARTLLRLSGHTEGVDAEIAVTGLRPGEKLHEELSLPEEDLEPSSIDRVGVLLNRDLWTQLSEVMDRVEGLVHGAWSWPEEELRETLFALDEPLSGSTSSGGVGLPHREAG